MPELTIRYNSPKTLEALMDFAKYFDFVISSKKPVKTTEMLVNGVTVILGNPSIDTSDLTKIFTGKNMDARKFRKQVWQRKK